MHLALITMCLRFLSFASGSLMDSCEAAVGTLETRHEQQLPTSPPDLFPPLPRKFGLVGADASSLSFAFYEPCSSESCLPICWYFKEENDSSWESYFQTSEQRKQMAGKLMTVVTLESLQPNTQYQVYSKMVINVEGTEDKAGYLHGCPPPSNFSRDYLVHTRTCEETVPRVQSLMVHTDMRKGVVLSWLPPKSKCTTLLEYRVMTLSNNESTESSGGKFWSNATDMVTGPTKSCVAYPERHCLLLGSTSAHIFHVQVKRTQDGALSNPIECRRISTLGPPGRPRGLQVVGAGAQSLELLWRLPPLPGPLPEHALVSVGAAAAVRNHTVCVRGQTLMAYKVIGLRPGTLFNVSVRFLENGIAGEPASVQARTTPERRRYSSSKPITSSMIDKLPRANSSRYVITSQNPFSAPRPTEQLPPRSNVTGSRSVSGEGDGAKAITLPAPLSTSHTTVRHKKTLNLTDANNKPNERELSGKANTTAEPNASCITDRNPLPKAKKPFSSSWKFIIILGMVLFVLATTSFFAGYCWGRQAAHSRDLRSRRSVYWGCCGAESDAYDAVARAAGTGRWARSRLLLPTSFQEYEELNPSRRAWGRGPRDNAATLDSNSSRSTGYSDYFFRGRLHRLPSAGLPLLHTSYQFNRAFDPHENEDVTQPPPYEVSKTENRFAQRGMQPLNPAELLQSQVASNQGSSNSTASRTARERTF